MENLDKINEILKRESDYSKFNEEEKQIINPFDKKIENSDKNKEELKQIFFESINKNYLYILKYIPIDFIFSEEEIINLLKSEINNSEIKKEIKNQIFSIIRAKGAEYSIKFFEELFTIQDITEDNELLSAIIDLYSFIKINNLFVEENKKEEKKFVNNIIELLNEKVNINVNIKGIVNNTLLYELIDDEPQNIKLIKTLIEKENIDLAVENCCNDTILDLISLNKNNKNNEEIIGIIIEKAKKTNQINNLLFAAIKNNKIDTVELLFNYPGIDTNEFNYYDAFHLAIESNNKEIIDLLKIEYSKISKTDSNNQEIIQLFKDEENIKLCYEYIKNKNYIKTSELIKNIKDLNLKVNGTTILHETVNINGCLYNNLFVNLILKQKNINLNIKDQNDLTPFELAVKNNDFRIVSELLNYLEKIKPGLDVNKLLYYACKNNSHLIFNKLIDNLSLTFPDLSFKYKENQNLLHIICSKEILDFNINEGFKLIKKLLDNKSNVNALNEKDDSGFTPLHLAIINNNIDITKYLLERKEIDLTIKDKYNRNLLHLSCDNKSSINDFSISFELTKLLLNSDINVLDFNIPDIKGNTPLDLAIQNNNLATIKILIRRINLENQNIKNLKLVKEENKIHLLENICSIGDSEKFSLLYNEEYFKNNFENPLFYFKLLNNSYIGNNKKIISKLEENLDKQIKNLIEKATTNDIINVLNGIIYNTNNPNFEIFNKITKNIENSNIKNDPEYQEYRNRNIFERINQNKQGENQTTIDRELDKNEKTGEIEIITDTAFSKFNENIEKNKNEILYETIKYNNDLIMINFYKKGVENNIELISATIDKDGIIRFSFDPKEDPKNLEKEINEILNNNYSDTKCFDYILSYLAYAPIQLKENTEENTIIKVNCNLETIVDTLKNSLEDKTKTYICDFSIDNHNVQTVIYEGKVYIINTGYDFNYLHKDIKILFNKKYKNNEIEVNEIKSIEQLGGNCVLASKLYLKSLIIQNKTNYKKFINIIKKLQDIYEKQELDNKNIIDYNSDMLNTQEKEELKEILDLNNEMFKNNKKHFYCNNLRFNKLKEFLNLKEISQQISNNQFQIISLNINENLK